MKILSLIVLVAFVSVATAQPDDAVLYFEQKRPSQQPEIFAPGIISKPDEHEFGSVFSKDGTEFYYGVDVGGRAEIRFTELLNNDWTKPAVIISHKVYGYNDPFLSPNEDRLYYISTQPLSGQGEKVKHDIWYSQREKNGWSKPINAGHNINSDKSEYYISFTNEGAMYFASNVNAQKDSPYNFDIYKSGFVNGSFQKPVRLPEEINSRAYEADVFIAPDESYIIFAAQRRGGLGRGDLYISFKNDDGGWTQSRNMGKPINSENHELCPFVTADGKYFFYTSNRDIYWVDARTITKLKCRF